MDLQNLALVQQLIALGADVNSVTYGGHVPYHLTFGRQNGEIRQQLFAKTASELREFPDSESESEDELMSDEDCVSLKFDEGFLKKIFNVFSSCLKSCTSVISD